MLRTMHWMTAAVAVVILTTLSVLPTRAEDAPAAKATGNIAGTVVDKQGNKVANITVVLFPAGTTKAAANNAPATQKSALKVKGEKPAKAAKQAPAQPIANATTDANGAFTMPGIPVGDYVVTAGKKGDATGIGHANVTVTDGATVPVTVTLATPGAKGKKAPANN